MDQQTPKAKRFNEGTGIGILFLLVGGVLLLRQSGYPFPSWLFSWEMILIVVGIFIGIRNGFRDFSWLMLILVGVIFLSDDVWPGFKLRQYAFPIIIISLGLLFILAPKAMCNRKHRNALRERHGNRCGPRRRGQGSGEQPDNTLDAIADVDNTTDTSLDIVSIFAGVKKKVLSKQFRGGEIVCIFGGSEINLSNADFISPIELELVQIFGGTKLVIPANWEVRSEIAAIFGGVDDKRPQPPNVIPEKTVILKGTIIFGGVEVNSY